MTRKEAVEFITGTNGKFFTVRFITRKTGELREMLARTGVKKGLTGAGRAYDPGPRNLLFVFDVTKDDYRSVPIEGITEIKVKGDWAPVTD